MYEHDVIVVGAGGAGLRAAIAAHEHGADVALVTKLHPVRSHTGAAEGGINAALHPEDSWDLHAYDTMKGSDYLADAPAVDTFAKEAPNEVIQLEHWGMPFSREEDGKVSQRPFGGLSHPRTTYAGAETGHHLLHTMYEQVVAGLRPRIGRPRVREAAERPLGDLSVLLAGERHAPVFELDHLVGCLLGERVDRWSVAEVVRAFHRVVGVQFPGILGVERGVDAALRCPRVAADRVEFRDQRHVGAVFVCRDRCPEAGAAGADHDDVVFVHGHQNLRLLLIASRLSS